MAEPLPGTSALVDLINSLPDPDGTWGPPITNETTLNGVPYAPYSKSDKLGRMADWTDAKDGRDGRSRQQYSRNYRGMLQSSFGLWRLVLLAVLRVLTCSLPCRPTSLRRRFRISLCRPSGRGRGLVLCRI